MQANQSDPAWAASQAELAAALQDPDSAYESFKARFRAPPPPQRRLQVAPPTVAVAQELHAHRKAAFLANVAYSAAENAKETNTCAASAANGQGLKSRLPLLILCSRCCQFLNVLLLTQQCS